MDEDARLRVDTSVHSRGDETLVVKFVPLPEHEGTRRWALVFHELSQSIPLPAELRQGLTQRQREVAQCVLRNWKNGTIARELSISPATVKVHVREIFRTLGIDNRADFMYQAARLLQPI